MSNKEYTPPHNIDAEQNILGACLMDSKAIETAAERIDDSFFYKAAHRLIWTAIMENYQNNIEVDLVTVSNTLQKSGKFEEIGGMIYLANLMDIATTAANVAYHVKIVYDKGMKRKMLAYAHDLERICIEDDHDFDQILETSDQKLSTMINHTQENDIFSPDWHNHFIELQHTIKENEDGIIGIPTGFIEIDKYLFGLRRGTLTLIGGHSKHGKTAFCLDIIRHVLKKDYAVAMFSIEMNRRALMDRVIFSEAQVNRYALTDKKSGLKTSEVEKLWEQSRNAVKRLSTVQNRFMMNDNRSLTINQLRMQARKAKQRMGKLDLVVVDSLMFLDAGRSKDFQREDQELSYMCLQLRALAGELDCAVISIHPFKQDTNEGKRPTSRLFRGSSLLEFIVDQALIVWRESVVNYTKENAQDAEIIIDKNRDGVMTTINLQFIDKFVTFTNPTDRTAPELPYSNTRELRS
jgi:replicative DNA helicase